MNDDDAVELEEAPPLDLHLRALHAMRDEGFAPELPEDAARLLTLPPPEGDDVLSALPDERGRLWSSIDNPDSRDLDQIEWAEQLPGGAIRVCVAVADVDRWVKPWTALDAYATRSTTSVYTGVATFPMLPEVLSTDRTSLNPDEDRVAIVVELVVEKDGAVSSSSVSRAVVRNHAKLDYESVGAWLEGTAALPISVARVARLAEQIRLQDEAAQRLLARRRGEGALELQTAEVSPVRDDEGRIVRLEVPRQNRAHALIENLMIAANAVVAGFLAERGLPAIARVVRPPERWPRIVALAKEMGETLPDAPDSRALAAFLIRQREEAPWRFADLSLAVVKLLGPGEYVLVRPGKPAGHFGLAAPLYTHSTAPNRRYPDLVIHRLIKAALAGEPAPYDAGDLDVLAAHCTAREDAARKVERTMRKVIAGAFLRDYIGETFRAVVTFSGRKGVFARLLTAPAAGVEGRIVAGEGGLDVGDVVTVRLVSTDPSRGFIDLSRLFT